MYLDNMKMGFFILTRRHKYPYWWGEEFVHPSLYSWYGTAENVLSSHAVQLGYDRLFYYMNTLGYIQTTLVDLQNIAK